MLITLLFPDVPDLCLETIDADEQRIQITMRVTHPTALCPLCAQPATRVHSRYRRTASDLPWATYIVQVVVQVRRFFCDTPICPRAIFAERLGPAIAVYARRTLRLSQRFQRIAFAVGAEGGAALSTAFGMPTSASTLLRVQRRVVLPTPAPSTIIGVDDFAFRKGQRYGTLIVDLERHCPIDVLPDREAATLATWLQARPSIAVVSRDRASAYADGVATGAPQAIQVADRFHLLKNASDTLQRVLQQHPAALRAAAQAETAMPPGAAALPSAPSAAPAPPTSDHLPVTAPPPPVLSEREQRFRTVLARHAQGWNVQQIARDVGLNWRTVKRYILARELPKRGGPVIQCTSHVRPYLGYVEQRWQDGCHNGEQLLREIRAQGYRGSSSSMCRALKPLRAGDGRRTVPTPSSPRSSRALSPRQAMWRLVRPEDALTDAERIGRCVLADASPALACATGLTQRFGHIIRDRAREELDDWLAAATSSGVSEFKQFAASIRRDYAAVTAALATEWSNGQLEGQVNRLKGIKKAMYGRGTFDLLRRRVLYAA